MTVVFAVFGQIMVIESLKTKLNIKVFFGACKSLDSATIIGVSLALWSAQGQWLESIFEKRKTHKDCNYISRYKYTIYILLFSKAKKGQAGAGMASNVVYGGFVMFCVQSFKDGRFWHHERSNSRRWPLRQMRQRKSYQHSMPHSFLKQTSPMKQRLRALVFAFSKLSHERLVFNSPWSDWLMPQPSPPKEEQTSQIWRYQHPYKGFTRAGEHSHIFSSLFKETT